ncbi:RAP domain [Chlorella sorokiniana]|uniref:RAP domain n=1 Tax=Chlorella sorokiniana TaxID=3076 RepID=A0A2P6U2W0_CHLSO|nr:RAP domain [Chlorella sorokiniana]|eukprot:PRW60650.1 RAP domain [Chlorella sorokiniana]
MWLVRLAQRRSALARLAAGTGCLAGPLEAGSVSLPSSQAAAPVVMNWHITAAAALRQLSSLAAPHAESGSSSSSPSSPSSARRANPSSSSTVSSRSSSASQRARLVSRLLTASLKEAASCQEVLHLVQQAGPRCDSYNFTTAVSRIAKLHRQQPCDGAAQREAFSQLLRFAAEQQLALGPVAPGQVVHAAAVLQYRFTAEQQLAWEERLVSALPAAEPQTVANALWGWSKLGLPLTHQLAAAADAAVQRTAAAMKPQEVSNTLWAFARSGWQLSSGAVATLRQRLQAVLPEAKPQEVANSLWALARLGLPLEGALAAAADAAVQQTAAFMKLHEMSNTLWAHASSGWQLSSRAAAALMQRLQALLPDAYPQAVVNSLWALAMLGLPLEGQLAATADAAVPRIAAVMNPQDVSNTLFAFARGGWQLSPGIAAALVQRLEAVLSEAKPQEVANSLWALAKLGLRLEDPLAAAAADAAVQRTAAFMKPQEVSNTLWAYATGCWQLSDSAAAVLQQRLHAVLSQCSPQAVANSLWALATLSLRQDQIGSCPPSLLSAVVAWADARWHQLPANWTCDLCFNLARLGAQPSSAWLDAAVARSLESYVADGAAGARFSNLVWACSKWQHRPESEALAMAVVAAVDNLAAEWRGKGRRGGLRLLNGLMQQPGGFCVSATTPAAAAALQDRLLPLLCTDIDLVASLEPEGGELNYLADCAASCAAVGLRLPAVQLKAICRYVQQHPQQLDRGGRANLQRAFEAWDHQPGLALLAELGPLASLPAPGAQPLALPPPAANLCVMWLARLARRSGSLARLPAGAECLAGGAATAQLEVGRSQSLPPQQAPASALPPATLLLRRLMSAAEPPAPAAGSSVSHSRSDATASSSSVTVPAALPSSSGGAGSGDATSHEDGGRGPSVLSGSLLTGYISHARSCKWVLQLVRLAGQHCDALHISAAAGRMAALHKQRPSRGEANRQAFGQLLRHVAGQQLEMDAVAVGQVLYAQSPALLDAIVAWADGRWAEVPAVWVCDLCYNLARLGMQPDRTWIEAAVAQCLACIEAAEMEPDVLFTTIVAACSKWQHRLEPEALAPLVVAAVDKSSAHWMSKGRRGGLALLRALAQQPGGFSVATAPPAAADALERRLLPLLCSDIDVVASLDPEGGELAYLADCAASCAAVGLRLPAAQLKAICRYVQQHPQQLDRGGRANLQRAFEAWGHQPGLALLAELGAAAA